MAVKAKAEITISRIIDIDKVTRYYILQSSTAAAPSKPTDGAAIGSNWSKTEPSYTSGSTMTLYFVDQTVMSNGSLKYSEVSKSSSYEAAKEAWNKANNAQNAANSANGKIDGLKIGGSNLLRFTQDLPVTHDSATGIGATAWGITTFQTYDGARIDYEGQMHRGFYIPLANAGSIANGETVTLSFDYRCNTTNIGKLWIMESSDPNIMISPNVTLKSDGEWHNCSFSFSSDESNIRTCIAILFCYGYLDQIYGQDDWIEIKKRSLKLEHGTVATDWSPAPEDFQNDLSTLSGRVTAAETNITNNATQIETKASQTEVTTIANNLNVYIDKNTSMIQDINGWQFNWDKLIRTAEADVAKHQDYITLQNGDIILGESASDLKLKISNDSIQFKGTADAEVTPDPDATAWITGRQFNINEGEIHNFLKIGRLQFLPRSNGNFAISIT